MIRVYVAGAISSPDIISSLMNLNRGIRASVELLLAGFAPYSPFIDFQFFLNLRPGEVITREMIYKYSMIWLEVSDCVLLLPNSEGSKGTQAELNRAEELGLPIYGSIEELASMEADR
jgi:hypothetical protein